MKDLNIYFLILTFSIFSSCNEIAEKKSLDFTGFSIEVPDDWEQKEFQGIDFAADVIMTKSGDTIHIDYGNTGNGFDDAVKVFSYQQIKKYDSLGLDTSNLFFSKKPSLDESQGTFLNEYYYYVNIDNRKAKMRVPKEIEKGVIGVDFDSIDEKGRSLVIYSRNLNSKDQISLMASIKTIKIKNK